MQVYVEMTPKGEGPVVALHVLAGVAVPEIAKLIDPLGATPPVEPVTVAVKVSDPPKVGLEVEVMATLGLPVETVVAVDEITAATG
jgi:hypothetical protein